MRSLEGQVALVTGGSRGIGRAICEELADLGASIAINYAKNEAAAQEVAESVAKRGSSAMIVGFDVAHEAGVDAGVKAVLERFSRLDILVNNAGIAIDGLLVRTKTDDWMRTINTNLSGCFLTARAVAKPMMKGRYGRIINVSSVIGEIGNAGQAAYSASKSGLFGLTKSLARELGSRNITVNAVTPGYIVTDMTKAMTDEQTQQIMQQLPLGRLGEAADVAKLVAFLASPGAGYVTGQIIGVNGGLHM